MNHHITQPDRNYSSCERVCATLCIYPKQQSVAEVTKCLQIEPTEANVAGEKRTNVIGREYTVRWNSWLLASEDQVESLDLRDHLDWLLANLFPVREQLTALQGWEGINMTVSVNWWYAAGGGGGPVLWPRQLRGLADLNLELAITCSDYNQE